MQHVNLDVLGEDAEGHLDRAGRPRGVEQRAEHRLADLPGAFLVERGLGEAVPDEIADIGNGRWAGREDLREDDDRNDLNRVRAGTVEGLSHRSLPHP